MEKAARLGHNYQNAFWSPVFNAMFFGDAKPYAGALDVVAHELTHGITAATCNLVYRDQQGALNEAFSDIFGEMVEDRTEGSTDWSNGTARGGDRSMKNPFADEIAPEFNLSGSCAGQTLPASGTCKLNVIFSPTTVEAKIATLTILSNDPDTPQMPIQLNGSAIAVTDSDLDEDGDVDGKDLATYANSTSGVNLEDLAADYGIIGCP